jgi:hypothetical protein
MGSQSGYFCVTIYAAAMFIENLTSEQLTIDREFFLDQLSTTTYNELSDSESVAINPSNPLEKDLETYMAEATASLSPSPPPPLANKPPTISTPITTYTPLFKVTSRHYAPHLLLLQDVPVAEQITFAEPHNTVSEPHNAVGEHFVENAKSVHSGNGAMEQALPRDESLKGKTIVTIHY